MKRSRLEQAQGAFIKEYEINASPRLLYPYISTAAGLGQWFADKALTLTDTSFNFIWDRQDHFATLATQKLNKLVRFEFPEVEEAAPELHPFIEFSLEKSPVSQSVFLKVVDKTTSTTEDPEEVWDSLVTNLKDLVGG